MTRVTVASLAARLDQLEARLNRLDGAPMDPGEQYEQGWRESWEARCQRWHADLYAALDPDPDDGNRYTTVADAGAATRMSGNSARTRLQMLENMGLIQRVSDGTPHWWRINPPPAATAPTSPGAGRRFTIGTDGMETSR